MKPTTRSRLLAAAPKLAAKLHLAQLTPEVIAKGARLSAADFMVEFSGGVDEYLDELNQQFLESILSRIVAQAGSLPPGLERMARASSTQLDICLEDRSLRSLLVEARRLVPRVAEAMHRRNQVTAMMISLELKKLGCPQPLVIARLYCMMVLEAAQIEADAGAAVPEVRKALADFLGSWVPVVATAKLKR
jgi:TetR/AcrR family transcriptional repressor of nem operon